MRGIPYECSKEEIMQFFQGTSHCHGRLITKTDPCDRTPPPPRTSHLEVESRLVNTQNKIKIRKNLLVRSTAVARDAAFLLSFAFESTLR